MRDRTRGGRAIAIAAVVSILALAGCGAVPNPLDDDPTRSAFDVEDTTSATTVPTERQYAEGITFDTDADRFPRPGELLAAHDASLANRSYTLEMTRVVEADDETRSRGNWVLESSADHGRYLQTIRLRNPDSNTSLDAYANGTHVWQRESTESGAGVSLVTDAGGDPVSPDRTRGGIPRSRVEAVLAGIEDPDVTRVRDSAVDVDTTVYRITTDQFGVEPNTTNAAVAVLVTEGGRILSIEYTIGYTDASGEAVRQRTTIEYFAVGSTTVDAPPWLPANATNATHGPVSTVGTAGSRVTVRLSSTGPATETFGHVSTLARSEKPLATRSTPASRERRHLRWRGRSIHRNVI